jgi:hypothetical protein
MAAEFARVQMQKGIKIDGTIRALAIALGGAILTSVIAMLIPVSVFEAITGATGFSELVPATGAPLGDTARALIAFGFGALAFAGLAVFLLRRPVAVKAPTAKADAVAKDVSDGPSFMDKMLAKLSDITTGGNNSGAVTELSDLPKLRAGDAHPDAPPRRPISAHRDFGEVVVEPVVEESAVVPVEEVIELPVIEAETDPATVTNMVDRLELAVAQRQDQIAKLEALASAEIAKPELVAPATVAEPEPAIVVEQPRQTILEAVPSEPVTELVEDDMDAALRSALETLHRMNVRTR